MCEVLELSLALIGSLALGVTGWAMRVGRDIAKVVSGQPGGSPQPPVRGYEEEWDMV